MKELDFEKGRGLVPAVVQDADSLQVLMVGYMNAEALDRTRESGRVVFYSRSKGRLWTKGEESGNFLEVASLEADCDGDALLVRARPRGPTCHLGTVSCFGTEDAPGLGFLAKLQRVIEARKSAPAGSESYVRSLLAAGLDRIAQKVGEEAVETVIASKNADPEALRSEASDLLFHLMVLLASRGLSLEEVAETLRARHR
jgi:phosphoribosyl-AMP cyclohydrolase / phosphoribosyl-ATP pyrophosphohydrolase